MWAVPLVGGTGEKGLDLLLWILWTLEAGRWVMSKIVFPDNNRAFPRTLPFSFPLITDMASDVGCTMQRMVWLQRCGKQKTTGNAISVMLFHTAETEQQEMVLSSGVLWLKDLYPLFLLVMSKWQVAVGCTSLLGKTLPLLYPSAHMATCFSLPARSLRHLHFHWMEICLCCSPVK